MVRYKKSEGGRLEKTAEVYEKKEHGIDKNLIDPEALKIISRLRRYGHSAYIVGGAVRDMMLNHKPKDFDIVTDAEPNQIKKLFRNSRIIGKRFRLVHIFFQGDHIVEVATFRSLDAGTFNNFFGTIEEDALRRDFTINGLYYDPLDEQILDFVHGFRDVKARKLKPIIPVKRIFVEDPVRMIRAVKYSSATLCKMSYFLRLRIKNSHRLLADVSPSRISEEVFKILQGGYARDIFRTLRELGLLSHIMPRLNDLLGNQAGFEKRFFKSMETLDRAVREHNETRRGIQLSYLVSDYLFFCSRWVSVKRLPFPEVYADIKDLLKPVTPPNVEVERALVYLIRRRKLYQDLGTLPGVDFGEKTPESAHEGLDGFESLRKDNDLVDITGFERPRTYRGKAPAVGSPPRRPRRRKKPPL